ncbi:MAG: class B sortase [Lachnospiraceae bacterium]|nr:class B sortase [Lachnospiraceae bacterium]
MGTGNRSSEVAWIKELRQTYDLTKEEDVQKLYSYLQSENYTFETPEGRAFDDELFERVQALKEAKVKERRQKRREGVSDISGGIADRTKRQSSESKTVTARKDEVGNKAEDGSNSGTKKKKRKKSRKKIVVLTKKEAALRKIVMGVMFLMALTCLGYFGFYVYDSYLVDQEAKRLTNIKNNDVLNDMYHTKDVVVKDEFGNEKVFTVLDEYKSLYNQNQNLIGWLKIADTHIDYPVMQSADNEYYLNHNSNLEDDRNGALFLDSSCNIQADNVNYIIYGHNMRSGKMFGDLDNYESQSFYEKHKTIYFDTIYEEGVYEVMYVFRSHVYQKDEVAFKYYQFIDVNSEEEFLSNMQEMSNMALYNTGVTAEYGDHLLTLSTCDYVEDDGRFVVVAKRVD